MGKRGFLVDTLKNITKDDVSGNATTVADDKLSHITLDSFKTVIRHFESKLQHTLLQALSSKEYMHVRSAMIAHSKVVSTFPATGRVPSGAAISSTTGPSTAGTRQPCKTLPPHNIIKNALTNTLNTLIMQLIHHQLPL